MVSAEKISFAQELSSETEPSPDSTGGASRKAAVLAGGMLVALLAGCAFAALAVGGRGQVATSNVAVSLAKSEAALAAQAEQEAGLAGPEPIPAVGNFQLVGGTGPSEYCIAGCRENGICCGSSCCAAGGICCNNKLGLCCSNKNQSVCCGNKRCCSSTLLCGQVFANDPVNQEPQCGGGQQF